MTDIRTQGGGEYPSPGTTQISGEGSEGFRGHTENFWENGIIVWDTVGARIPILKDPNVLLADSWVVSCKMVGMNYSGGQSK